ncbi:MAG: hypothetical protein H6578_09215 [Chitinophagales bacterium]|nr:hypothetical protein [Chitinophagales bacterium]
MIQTVRLSTFDRLLNIHQSVKLEELTKLNKRMLDVQVHQSKQLNALNKQLSETTQLNKQILDNQIAEITLKEEQRFYKSLAFNNIQILELINNIQLPKLKKYFVETYYLRLKKSFEDAIQILEEISDKSEIKEHMKILKDLKNESSANSDLSKTVLDNLNSELAKYQKLENDYNQKITESYRRLQLIEIPSKGLFGLNKSRHYEQKELKNKQLFNYENLRKEKENVLNNHSLHKSLKYLEDNYPTFETISEEIQTFDKSLNDKFFPKPKIILTDEQKRNNFFLKACKAIILNKQGSVSLIQRTLKVGVKQATKILDEMETTGLVKPNADGSIRKVVIDDYKEFEKILNE